MENIKDITFSVNVHFENGITITKEVPLKRAVHLAMRDNVLVDPNAELLEIHSSSGDTIIIPMSMIFVVHKSPEFKSTDYVNRRGLYERDNGQCQYCGKKLTLEISTIEHIIPRSKGGPNTWSNVVLSCVPCNRKKDNRTPEEAHMPLLKKPHKPTKKVLKYRK